MTYLARTIRGGSWTALGAVAATEVARIRGLRASAIYRAYRGKTEPDEF